MCMTDLLTISEYSKIRGCSVSAVYKRLKSPSNRIHSYVVRQDGKIFLKAEILAAEELRSDCEASPPRSDRKIEGSNTAPNPVEEVEEGAVEEGIGALAIRALEQQLSQKDKIIEDLNRRLEDAARHEREISDRMAELVAQANELQKNNQLLLAQAQQRALIEQPPEPDPDPIQEPINTDPEPPRKKPGLWARIFGSRRNEE